MTTDLIQIRIPMQIKKRGVQKTIITPENISGGMIARFDRTLINTLARAYRWKKLYETGGFPSIDAFCNKHRLNKSYAARIMRLNLLAPDIREAILEGRQPKTLQLAQMLAPFPIDWREQRSCFGFAELVTKSKSPKG